MLGSELDSPDMALRSVVCVARHATRYASLVAALWSPQHSDAVGEKLASLWLLLGSTPKW